MHNINLGGIGAVKIWAISNDYFIYKPALGDENFDCFHIVNLDNGNSTLLVKDCVNDPTCKKNHPIQTHIGQYLAYLNGILYIANKSTCFLMDVKHEMTRGEVKKIDIANEPTKI
jgi:hypothetical protein